MLISSNVIAQRHILEGPHIGGYDPQIELGRDFAQCINLSSFVILCLLVRKSSCWQTNTQTDAAENIQRSSLRYDVG